MTHSAADWEGTREQCPHCASSLTGPEIPVADRPIYGGATTFSRVIGIEVRGAYDGTLYWQCPDCGGAWQRFPADHPRAAKAAEFIDRANVTAVTR